MPTSPANHVVEMFSGDGGSLASGAGAYASGAESLTKCPWGPKLTFQGVGSMASGTGEAVISIQGSLDNAHWVEITSFEFTGSDELTEDGVTLSEIVDAAWAYVRAVASQVDDGGTVQVYMCTPKGV